MGQFRRECIFCESGTGSSKEDFIPVWLSKRLPHVTESTSHFVSGGRRMDNAVYRGALCRPGSTINQTVQGICSNCNNGWMSKVVESAKGAISKIVFDQDFQISPSDFLPIRRQALISTIGCQLSDRDTFVVPFEERQRIMFNMPLQLDWNIWLSYTDVVQAFGAFNHVVTKIFSISDRGLKEIGQCSLTIIYFGPLVFCVLISPSCSFADYILDDKSMSGWHSAGLTLLPFDLESPIHLRKTNPYKIDQFMHKVLKQPLGAFKATLSETNSSGLQKTPKSEIRSARNFG